MRNALRLWERHQELRALELNRLKRTHDERMASAKRGAVDAGSLLAELAAERRG